MRILVIDDSEIFLAAVREVLESTPEFTLVGEARSGESGVVMAEQLAPDLVLLDIILPGADGIETCRSLHDLDPRPLIVLCSVNDDPRLTDRRGWCSDVPFLAKTAISPAALRRLWRDHQPSPAVVSQ